MTTLKHGLLIVFEGIDGTGKSTQLEMAGDFLTDEGFRVFRTREPTTGPFGLKIRALYQDRQAVSSQDELELFISDRREHVASVIVPALQRGEIVLCDRYYLSTAAYQGAAGLDPADIIQRNSFAPPPDLALLFTLDVQHSIRRITEKRGDTLNDFEQLESLQSVDRVFRQMQFDFIRRVDASGTVDQVHQEVRHHVLELLHNRLSIKEPA